MDTSESITGYWDIVIIQRIVRATDPLAFITTPEENVALRSQGQAELVSRQRGYLCTVALQMYYS